MNLAEGPHNGVFGRPFRVPRNDCHPEGNLHLLAGQTNLQRGDWLLFKTMSAAAAVLLFFCQLESDVSTVCGG